MARPTSFSGAKSPQGTSARDEPSSVSGRTVHSRKRLQWVAVAMAIAVVTAGIGFLLNRGDDGAGSDQASSTRVGGDLHTVTIVGSALFVGGHDAVGISRDGGQRWQTVPSLAGADAMGWAVTNDAVLVGGHPGLYRSTDKGMSFTKVSGPAAVPDVHALGGAGTTAYLASPQAGLLASTDAGRSWQVRNASVGRSFMGTILVDRENHDRLVAPDMAAGLSTSTDGGRTWKSLGGPSGAMAAAWNPTNTRQILAVGMNGGARSTDGGATWQKADLPPGTSAISYDPTGRTLYAGALDGELARTFRSSDGGITWTKTG